MSDPINIDVLIIGCGPAGICAAVTAARFHKKVIVVDDGPDAGGQIWRAQQRNKSNAQAQAWLQQLNNPLITRWHNTRLITCDGTTWQFCQHDKMRYVRAVHIIIATGAREIFAPFIGWTLPQVIGAGGLQALIKNGVDVQGQRVIIAGTGPLLLASADTARRAGAKVVAIVEQASFWRSARFAFSLWRYPQKIKQLLALLWSLKSIPYWRNARVEGATGDHRVRHVVIARKNRQISVHCDWLACAYGLQANTDIVNVLALHQRQGFVSVNDQQQTSLPFIYAAGEITGIGGVDKAMLEGQIAALHLCGQQQVMQQRQRELQHQRHFVAALKQFCDIDHSCVQPIAQDEIICRCEDVRHHALLACRSGREARLYTRAGMGACQGRICGPICHTQYGWSPVGQRAPWTSIHINALLQEEKS